MSFMSSFNKAGNVSYYHAPPLIVIQNSQIGGKGSERISSYFWFGC